VVSKPQIWLKGKAQSDEKAQHTRQYVNILKRFATQPLGHRWDFETTSCNWVQSTRVVWQEIKVI
jgi:hypothetical protein